MVMKGQYLERATLIPVGDEVMEGLSHRGEHHPPLLIVPPAPDEGGGMDHVVAAEVAWASASSGHATLRFNFRGVGASDGTHDEGRGEVGDVAAAVSWLRGIAAGVPLLAVGYSFGSWCAIRHAVGDPDVAAVIAIGLPVRAYGLEEVGRLLRPFRVVQGSEDEFGSPDEVRAVLARAGAGAELIVIPGASHLFPGRAQEAAAAVAAAADRILRGGEGVG